MSPEALKLSLHVTKSSTKQKTKHADTLKRYITFVHEMC